MGVDDSLNEPERRLHQRYSDLHERFRIEQRGLSAPRWAHQFLPAIPFVGSGYGLGKRPKVLVYASAENLTGTKHRKWLGTIDQMLRSRIMLAANPGSTNVHIQPINNGSLLMAARHALRRIDDKLPFDMESAPNFLEEIAVANPGKFSIEAKHNQDYAGRESLWSASSPYIRADIEELKPDILIIPRTIRDTLRKIKDSVEFSATVRTVAPNYQITARTINRHIKPKLNKDIVQEADESSYRKWTVPRSLDMEAYLRWIDEVAITWVERN